MRITPAYAGKSSAQVNVKAVKEDHPRVCGEKDLGGLALTVVKGSPPRMRGKAYDPEGRARRRRITPAYAGKRHPFHGVVLILWDHPRVCGEKKWACMRKNCPIGSPPRVRGKVQPLAQTLEERRITPACAGKSTTGRGART